MTATFDQAIRRLRARASRDDDVVDAVVFLADVTDDIADPSAPPGDAVVAAASAVNRRRIDERRALVRERALTTPEVVKLLNSIGDRKGVDRRRRRGQLLGWRVGNQTLHPRWQFDANRGDTRPGLAQLLAALSEVSDDPLTADALVTTPRPDLGGRTIADVFASGDVTTALRLVRMAADQS